MPLVLGLDTSTASTSVAVGRGGEILREEDHGPGADGRPRHVEVLLGAVEGCVAAAGGWDRIDRVAVGLGPGSYTGLRIGIATARSLCQARGLPIVGVPTLSVLARAIGEHPDATSRLRMPILDARRGQGFAAAYDEDGGEALSPVLAGPDELAAQLADLSQIPLAAGDGAVRFRSKLEAAGALIPPDGDAVHRVAARQVCALAVVAEPSAPERIEPLYLRAPDAETWLHRDRGKPPR